MQLEDSDNENDSFERHFYDLTDVDEDDVHNFITEATGASLLDRCVSIIHVEHTLWNCRLHSIHSPRIFSFFKKQTARIRWYCHVVRR